VRSCVEQAQEKRSSRIAEAGEEETVRNEALAVSWKPVEDMLVAGIRFEGRYEDIYGYFEKLEEKVGAQAIGERIAIYHGRGRIEVATPVREPVESGEVATRALEGAVMLTSLHRGRYGSPEAGKKLGETWGKLWRYTIEHHVGVTEEPWREVYLEDDPDDPGAYTAELQIPMLLPKWLVRFRDGLDRHAGEEIVRHVLEGSENLSPESDPSEKVAWVKGAMARLDEAVPDDDTRREIVSGCAHVYPEDVIAKLKDDYERLGSIDALLDSMQKDPGYEGSPYYRDPEREGNVIFIDKAPQEREKHESTTDPRVRRAAACHCPIIKAAILADEAISPTFCHCATGWFKPVWEGLLGRPVRIICEESVLQGHDRCRFAIYLPEDVR
jgi:effector-binding domain-containing protein